MPVLAGNRPVHWPVKNRPGEKTSALTREKRVDAGRDQANTGGMELYLWIGLISFVLVGLALGVLGLITMVRNAGHR